MKNKSLKVIFKKYWVEIVVILFAVIFSTWLMLSTFFYNDGFMLISTLPWSDFSSHIPLIRSFSLGDNFPPQYPLFSGPPIKYHFLFYALAGLLEKLGLRIDYALNIPSILGFSFLIIMIYVFSKTLFKSRAVGILSIIFFLFNSSLDFVNFFGSHPFSLNIINTIIKNQSFPSFGPYDGKIISAFWSLNIYTNQRHLALSYALSLLLIYLVLKFKDKQINKNVFVVLGFLLGLSFFLNIAVFIITIVVLSCFLLFFPKKRLSLLFLTLTAGIIAIPQYMFIANFPSTFQPAIHLGYLTDHLNFLSFVNYWWQNLGLSLILIPLGFMLAKTDERKILLCVFTLFIIGNVFQFSPEIAANHKFFNFFIIIGNMFSAFLIVRLWKKKLYLKPISILLIILLILSGIIDFFPIFNDSKIKLADYPVNKDVAWIINNTPKNSIFLNTNYIYDNASLAGRKIYMGWPYFAWSQGYDTNKRGMIMADILGEENKPSLCSKLENNHINYIEISGNNLSDPNLPRVSNLLKVGLVPVYQNTLTNYKIYSSSKSCIKL